MRIGMHGSKQIQRVKSRNESRLQNAPIHKSSIFQHRLKESLFEQISGKPALFVSTFSHLIRVSIMRFSDGAKFGFHWMRMVFIG